jgi:hypothetical protein
MTTLLLKLRQNNLDAFDLNQISQFWRTKFNDLTKDLDLEDLASFVNDYYGQMEYAQSHFMTKLSNELEGKNFK